MREMSLKNNAYLHCQSGSICNLNMFSHRCDLVYQLILARD